MKVKVKICGINTIETAQAALAAGADFLGFNFVPDSKRHIEPEEAKKIIDKLPKTVKKVGVFVDEDMDKINRLAGYLKLDFVQLHGLESPEYVASIGGVGKMKTFPLDADFDIGETIKKMKTYKADYFLLDREKQGRGELLNPKRVKRLTAVFPIILAGGLTVENVAETVRKVRPQIVDVAGGVETNGVKDTAKIIKFINEAKKYDI